MTTAPTALRDVAQAVLDAHGVSGRRLEELARKKGQRISYTTINSMAAGTYTSTPTDVTLDALVSLSGLPVEEVYVAAARPMPRRRLSERLPLDADSRTVEQEEAVLAVVREFARASRALAARREDMGSDERSASTSSAGRRGVPSGEELEAARERGRKDARTAFIRAALSWPKAAVEDAISLAHPDGAYDDEALGAAYQQGWETLSGEERDELAAAAAVATDTTMPGGLAARSGKKGNGRAQAERDRQDEETER